MAETPRSIRSTVQIELYAKMVGGQGVPFLVGTIDFPVDVDIRTHGGSPGKPPRMPEGDDPRAGHPMPRPPGFWTRVNRSLDRWRY